MRNQLIIHPEELSRKWIDRMADAGITVLGIHPKGGKKAPDWVNVMMESLRQPEFRALLDYAAQRGLQVEYELHAAGYLIPRALFDTHPDYFRMTAEGRRSPDWNFCVSNEDALHLLGDRAAELALALYGSGNSFYFWLDDGRDTCCHCPKCRRLSPSDQQLIAVNTMQRAVRKRIPGARMAYLAYMDSIVVPEQVQPADGVFLEYAPFEKYTNKTENAPAMIRRELDMLEPLMHFFGKDHAKVLEYWYDNSMYSNWTKPPQKLVPDTDALAQDTALYRRIGFDYISSFACFLGGDYEALYGEIDIAPFVKYTQ